VLFGLLYHALLVLATGNNVGADLAVLAAIIVGFIFWGGLLFLVVRFLWRAGSHR
jgi:hypothetical protein